MAWPAPSKPRLMYQNQGVSLPAAPKRAEMQKQKLAEPERSEYFERLFVSAPLSGDSTMNGAEKATIIGAQTALSWTPSCNRRRTMKLRRQVSASERAN